jgi:glycosyltransferase involved in cell wall biosynthesis
LRWHIITGEYPPQPGGVSDYTYVVARGLLAAGDLIDVWAPPCRGVPDAGAEIRVHRLPDHFGPRSIAAMQKTLRPSPGDRVLVQFVPHAYGWKAMNLPLCVWLAARYRKYLSVTFHEVSYPIRRGQSLRHNFLGAVTRLMALTLARSARDVIISTPAWEPLLGRSIVHDGKVRWVPVPSNVPVVNDVAGVSAIRSRFAAARGPLLGHFGTYGNLVADPLMQILPAILSQSGELPLLLLGRGSEAFRERLLRENPRAAGRIHAAGELSAGDLSRHISACDLFVQYYPDGITTRRTSLMALLAHGRPVVATCGPTTESVWRESDAVAMAPADDPPKLARLVVELVDDEVQRRRLESAAIALYDQRFALRHTIAALRRNLPAAQAAAG